jgi:hypothetical protein
MTDAIRPLCMDVPEDTLVDLRCRIRATRWPERETVTDESQGVQLATCRNSHPIGEPITLAQMRGDTQTHCRTMTGTG